jgi:hypothetical protein
VQEVILEEAIQLPPENFLFMGPEPPIILPGDEIRADTGVNNMASPVEDFPVCYIEEEILDEYLQMAQNDLLSEGLAPLTVSEREPGSTGTGAEGGVEEWSTTTGHQEDVMDGTWAAVEDGHQEDAMDGRTSKEGGEVLAPPPSPTPSDQWRVPSTFFHPDQLDFVLDLRRQMAD